MHNDDNGIYQLVESLHNTFIYELSCPLQSEVILGGH